MKSTKIISAFPACGKSYIFNQEVVSCLDSDSSKFSWVLDDEGNSTGTRNPLFPNNYIEHIKANLGKVDYIFVSSHDDVKSALELNGLSYTLVMPESTLKYEWIGRCWARGNDEGFLNLINNMWETWTDKEILENKWNPSELIYLKSGEYLSDKL